MEKNVVACNWNNSKKTEILYMTKNAEAILNIINESTCHPTAEDIYMRMKQEHSKVVLATVYNNLNSLCEAGLARKLVMEGAPDRYDKVKRHDHVMCVECGAIGDFFMDDITRLLEEKLGNKVLSYDLMCRYICPECRKKPDKKLKA